MLISEDKLAWEEAKFFFVEAFTVTIFGYGAPRADLEAKKLLKNAWFSKSPREIEHMEIIDVLDSAELCKRWGEFMPTHHLKMEDGFEKSWLYYWPRRSCEVLTYTVKNGLPCEYFSFPDADDLEQPQEYVYNISQYEKKNDR